MDQSHAASSSLLQHWNSLGGGKFPTRSVTAANVNEGKFGGMTKVCR